MIVPVGALAHGASADEFEPDIGHEREPGERRQGPDQNHQQHESRKAFVERSAMVTGEGLGRGEIRTKRQGRSRE